MRKRAVGFLAISLVVTCLALLGCPNPASLSEADPDAPALSLLQGRGGWHGHFKIIIRPSGDLTGATDRSAIQQALEDCSRGGVVELKKGHYYIDGPVVAEGFKGTLRGAGMNRTIVETAEGFTAADIGPILGNNVMGVMFGFFFCRDYVTVEDMTLQVLGPTPCKEYASVFLGFNTTTILSNHLVIGGVAKGCRDLTATCTRVRFVAGPSEDPFGGGSNVTAPVAICGGAPSQLMDNGYGTETFQPVNAKVEGCRIEGCGMAAIIYYKGCEGWASIRRTAFVDCLNGIVLVEKNQGCDIVISGNDFRGTMGGNPIVVPPDSEAKIVCNSYDDLESCSGGFVVVLAGGGNEVYEDLTGRLDLSILGDPTKNTIVTDFDCNCGPSR